MKHKMAVWINYLIDEWKSIIEVLHKQRKIAIVEFKVGTGYHAYIIYYLKAYKKFVFSSFCF